jgi:hypothetical protein
MCDGRTVLRRVQLDWKQLELRQILLFRSASDSRLGGLIDPPLPRQLDSRVLP